MIAQTSRAAATSRRAHARGAAPPPRAAAARAPDPPPPQQRQRQQQPQPADQQGAGAIELFRGAMPLVGFERAAALLPPPLAAPLRLHTFVLLDARAAGGGCFFYDFLPEDPAAPATAAALLAGRAVRGVARARRLAGRAPRQLPAGAALARAGALVKCDAVAIADAFTREWGPDLSLASRNCRHHTAALVAALLAAERGAGP